MDSRKRLSVGISIGGLTALLIASSEPPSSLWSQGRWGLTVIQHGSGRQSTCGKVMYGLDRDPQGRFPKTPLCQAGFWMEGLGVGIPKWNLITTGGYTWTTTILKAKPPTRQYCMAQQLSDHSLARMGGLQDAEIGSPIDHGHDWRQ